MYRTLTLNVAATAVLAAAAELPRVRVREVDGLLQIRPTDRASDVNLPKGEILRNLGRKSEKSVTIGLPADAIPSLEAGTVVALEGEPRYGWFTLKTVADLPKGRAGGRISAK